MVAVGVHSEEKSSKNLCEQKEFVTLFLLSRLFGPFGAMGSGQKFLKFNFEEKYTKNYFKCALIDPYMTLTFRPVVIITYTFWKQCQHTMCVCVQ
jgi:hypothetical protein